MNTIDLNALATVTGGATKEQPYYWRTTTAMPGALDPALRDRGRAWPTNCYRIKSIPTPGTPDPGHDLSHLDRRAERC